MMHKDLNNELIYDITNNPSDKDRHIHALKKFIAMSGVAIWVKEFDSPRDWMNYLSNIAKLAEKLILSAKK